jgi:hypothetical protein
MKLCKDCKFGPKPFQIDFTTGHTAYCSHPNAPVDPVFGNKDGSFQLMRSVNCLVDHCGPNGDWFEEAPSCQPPVEPKRERDYAGTYGGTDDVVRRTGFLERMFGRWL